MKNGIPYDGFGQVLEMLRQADAGFREKTIRNLKRLDPALARRLEIALQGRGGAARSDNREVLQRSQRAVISKNYGN